MEILRWIAALALILFTGYTIYALRTEPFLKTFRERILPLRWGKQITADLYIGLLLFHFFVYLHQGSLWVTLAWLVPALALGNPVTLLYFVIYFDSIVAKFLI